MEPAPTALEGGVLTTGPQGSPYEILFETLFPYILF